MTPTDDAPLGLTYVRMSAIRPAERNPRIHGDRQVRVLANFMARVGFFNPCRVDERTQRLVAGHGRLDALGYLLSRGRSAPKGILIDDDGEWLVPLTRGWSSKDDAEAEAVVIGDNRMNALGEWHHKTTGQMLEDLQAADADLFEKLDYSAEDMDDVLARMGEADLNGQAPGSGDVEHALRTGTGGAPDAALPEEPPAPGSRAAREDADMNGDGSTGGPGESSGKKQVRCPHCGGSFQPGDRF